MAIPAVLAAIGAPIALGLIMSAAGPLRNLVVQQAFKLSPNNLLDVVNLINQRHRGLIQETRYNEEMEKNGFNTERAALLFKGSDQLLQAYEIVNLWRREGATEKERDLELTALGYTPGRIENILKVSEEIPSARDVIAFAVREVYSPEIAAAFGQYEGASEVYGVAKSDLVAAGMPEETFKKYWAAHWALPSVGQGYEMMHRKVIENDDLDRLMIALDIMPWWRDKLKAISYNPYTRVDIRRMHKIGVLTDDELVEAFEANGYDPEKAARMAEFTIIYNFGPEAAEMLPEDRQREVQKEASRGAIIKAYKGYIIERSVALLMLEEIGYSPDAADLYVTTADLDIEEDITDKQVDTVHDLYVRRLVDKSDATGRLGTLNLPGKQSDALMANWDVERDSRTNRPSKAELFKMHKLGIISEAELRNELEGLGYVEKTINRYLLMQKGK